MAEGHGAAAWEAARGFIGVRFRLHGRDPASGLDCVGLVTAAYRAAGVAIGSVPERYRLSGPEPAEAAAWLAACGAEPASDDVRSGDILLADLGAGGRRQLHLLLLGPGGACAIHAHAGLRRVVWSVEAPGVPVGRWRVV